jgi:hypothetical protein
MLASLQTCCHSLLLLLLLLPVHCASLELALVFQSQARVLLVWCCQPHTVSMQSEVL